MKTPLHGSSAATQRQQGRPRFSLRFVGCCVFAFILAACAADSPLNQAREHLQAGRGEHGLSLLEQATRADPANHAYRTEYFRSRELLVTQWLGQAETLRTSGRFDLAQELYQRIQKHDPENARARAGLEQAVADQRHHQAVASAERLTQAGDYTGAGKMLRAVLAENPRHRDAARLGRVIEDKTAKPLEIEPRFKAAAMKPMLIELRDVPLAAVFDVISRTAGINFVFDKDVRTDQKTTVMIRDATVEEILLTVLAANQLEKKMLSESTALIFPRTPQKLREYQELIIKAFYLVNADVKQTAAMIRTLVRTRDIFVDEKLNMLVIKDTPNAIRLAEKLVAAHDLAEPEVMLEVEVLEIGHNRLTELGLKFPDQITYGAPLVNGVAPGITELRRSNLVALAANPLLILNLKQQDGATSVLANPRIRVKNREKARIHIGDRVPTITTTAAASGGFISESISYLDVGLKLEVEPLIHLDDEVGIKVGLEVSNILREVRGANNGSLSFQIGTRNANTVLRLKDGETQILAGLINDEDRRTADRVPGIGELPVVGRLFSSHRDTVGKTEIVLLITPRLVRTIARPEARAIEFAAGTDASSGVASAPVPPPAPAVSTPVPTPAAVKPVPQELVPFGGIKPPAPR